jgi:hypothetical protein
MNNICRNILLTLIVLPLAAAGCRKAAGTPAWTLETDSGAAVWDTTGTSGVSEDTYRDQGVEKKAILADASGPGVLKLVSQPVTVAAGRPVAFTFALRFEHAEGRMFEARLELLDKEGKLFADSLLYSISSREEEDSLGRTREWISYTRAIDMPDSVTRVRVRVDCAPSQGKVWLGETALREGEGWLGYASAFSSFLGQNPSQKYVFTAGRLVDPESPPEPSPAETQAGLLVFERSGLVRATPYVNPRPLDRVEAFNVRVPCGTVAPFAFGVKALEELAGVEVSVSKPLSGPQGELRTRPVIYQGRYAAARLEGSWGKEFGIRVRLLERPGLKPLPKDENRFFWVDVPVPENTVPGIYEGQLSLRAGDRPPLSVTFRVEVLPVNLPPLGDSLQVGFYYYPPLDQPELMEAQIKDMAAHGIFSLSLSGAFVVKTAERTLALDLERVRKLDRLMGMMRKYGFFRPTPFYVADLAGKLDLPEQADKWTEENKRFYERAIRMMDDTARNWRWCKLMFFPVDEPANDPERMKLARLTLGILHSMPGITTLCDLNTPASVEELSRYLNAVVIQISSVNPQILALERENNVQAFMYLPAYGSSDVGSDAAYHRAIPGWFLPRTGARGIYYFAYQSVTGDPYDELDGDNRDWCAAYPAPEPDYAWPSPEYQGIRRGIEDLRLVLYARSLIERCQASPDQQAKEAGDTAGQVLASIMNTIQPAGPEVLYQLHNQLETYICERWRQELLGKVLAMQEALK